MFTLTLILLFIIYRAAEGWSLLPLGTHFFYCYSLFLKKYIYGFFF